MLIYLTTLYHIQTFQSVISEWSLLKEFFFVCFFCDTLHIVPFGFRNRNIYYIWVICYAVHFHAPLKCIDISDICLYTHSLMCYGIGWFVSLSILLDKISEMYMIYKNRTIIKINLTGSLKLTPNPSLQLLISNTYKVLVIV